MRFGFILVSFLVATVATAQIPNDNLDDTAALQARLDSRDLREWPVGTLLVSDTLRLTKTMGYRIAGSGGSDHSPNPGWDKHRYGTILKWNGPPGKPMLELTGCGSIVIDRVNFRGNAAIGIQVRDGAGSLNYGIRDCGFTGQDIGVQWATGATEGTCANCLYDNCHFSDHKVAGVILKNLQSLEHTFLRCEFMRTPFGVDVQAGGDVSIIGGGTYDLGCLLRLDRVGRNSRGFDIQSVRFDGGPQRTVWLAFANPKVARTYGTITIDNCSMNHGQNQAAGPLVTAAPGSRVVVRACSFDGTLDNLSRVYSDNRAGGELIFEYCDGLDGTLLSTYTVAEGDRAYYEFIRCGNLYSTTGSFSTFPTEITVQPGPFTDDEITSLKNLLELQKGIAGAVEGVKRIQEGELQVVLPKREE